MTFFVTGVSGFVGNVFLRKLLRRISSEDQVFVLSRKPLTLSDHRVQRIDSDLTRFDEWKSFIHCDYIFHIGALATYGNTGAYYETNVQPVENMLRELQSSARLRNFIFISTIGAVDRVDSDRCLEPIRIDSEPAPRSKYGQSKLAAEILIRESGLPYTIVRPTWVYGSGMRENSHINVLISMVARSSMLSKFQFPGKVSVINVDDLCQGLLNCIENHKVVGQTYFAATESISIGEIFRVTRLKLGRSTALLPVPGFHWLLSRLHKFLPLTISNLFLNYLWADGAKFIEDCGISQWTNLSSGITEVIHTNPNFEGKWIITGANSGIGLALARIAARYGRSLILIDRNDSTLRKEFANHHILTGDLGDEKFIDSIAAQISSHKISCLVNNAGMGAKGAFFEQNSRAITSTVKVNVLAPLLLTNHLADRLIKDRSVIVNVCSSIAYNPLPFMAVYACTKSALMIWSESLSYELKSTNRVITFAPSGTHTNFQTQAGVKVLNEGKGLATPEFVARKIWSSVNNGRKKVVILGPFNKVLIFLSRLLPRSMNIELFGRLFQSLR